jgi:hypothetical protein
MRAELVDEPTLPSVSRKAMELLAHDGHALLRAVGLGDLARAHDRHPVAAHQVAHRRARPGAHQRLRHLSFHTRPAWKSMQAIVWNEMRGQ